MHVPSPIKLDYYSSLRCCVACTQNEMNRHNDIVLTDI